MRLKDLKSPRKAADAYIGTLTDVSGDTHYELAISGPSTLIKKVFAESEWEYQIDSKATESNWVPRYQELWSRYADPNATMKQPETVAALSKTRPLSVTPANSIVVSVRRTQGRGTWWAWAWPALAIPRGVNLFFVLPPICNCTGSVIPLAGDADLFLSANGPRTPVIAASTRGVGLVDTVAFGPAICWPWQEFVPWFRVNGFTNCVTAFAMSGFGVVP